MKGVDVVAHILKEEKVDYLFCFPANKLIDSAAKVGIRPIMTRTERTLVNMADGFSRISNGNQIGVAVVQSGPGSENAFAGVAQAFADSIPILMLPGGVSRRSGDIPTHFSSVKNYAHVTKWVAQANFADRLPNMLRRAYSLLRSGHLAPVMIEIPTDVGEEEVSDYVYTPPKPIKSIADPVNVRDAVDSLLMAKKPILFIGQGSLFAEASPSLIRLAEMLQIPVMTTMGGKGTFPENHPLSVGASGLTGSGVVKHFLSKADLILGIGSSMSKNTFAPQVPSSVPIIHNTASETDINKDCVATVALLGDARLVTDQLIDEIASRIGVDGRTENANLLKEIAEVKADWLSEWMPRLTSNEIPINPYRVVWDLQKAIDRTNAIVTHDSGNPRDQMVPFYETLIPNGYIGWGKSTQLGYSLGLMMGAKLAAPDRLAINVMGDAAFGMSGLDLETAVREKIPILTIVLNNSALGGYEKHMPVATEHYGTKFLTGDYTKIAEGLGAYSQRVEKPENIIPSIQQACEIMEQEQRPALIEFITCEDAVFSYGH